ncbi:uncharacterized protein TRIADDRAFT_54929 [Trichoplax adhaerens]|uniref:Uncharacterized protein n=1 Tax=Trichoplax adhaerens TaxID=10228 RepID=B3RTD9_TRIAD|nr:predicted protein [Trichoplax adhaerens]EDV27208.1 predicted protein [Trichoplax adhaerens]|eukprot:XP_002111204.1 predicted protein [Trichoplax adhaerens]
MDLKFTDCTTFSLGFNPVKQKSEGNVEMIQSNKEGQDYQDPIISKFSSRSRTEGIDHLISCNSSISASYLPPKITSTICQNNYIVNNPSTTDLSQQGLNELYQTRHNSELKQSISDDLNQDNVKDHDINESLLPSEHYSIINPCSIPSSMSIISNFGTWKNYLGYTTKENTLQFFVYTLQALITQFESNTDAASYLQDNLHQYTISCNRYHYDAINAAVVILTGRNSINFNHHIGNSTCRVGIMPLTGHFKIFIQFYNKFLKQLYPLKTAIYRKKVKSKGKKSYLVEVVANLHLCCFRKRCKLTSLIDHLKYDLRNFVDPYLPTIRAHLVSIKMNNPELRQVMINHELFTRSERENMLYNILN